MVVVVVLYERKKKKEEIPLQKRERLEVEKMERFLLFCKVDDREGREFLVVLSFKFFFGKRGVHVRATKKLGSL